MELPKIKNKDLPKELKEILGDADAEFEAIVDPTDIINVELDLDEYYEGKYQVQRMLIENRKQTKKYYDNKRHTKTVQENNQSTQEE